MKTDPNRQPKGVPVGGQFAATTHNEAAFTLASPGPALPELEAYGEIPTPLKGQTLETGEPAEATFEGSYRAYFRPLDEYETSHGPFTGQQPISEAEILDLAGIGEENLGRHRGTSLERDDDTGEPVIVVYTRNGGGNRECWQDDCDGQCTGCIQTDAIPALPTYLRDEDDEGDRTYANNYFCPVDAATGRAALEAQERQQLLGRLKYFRDAITTGKQPPWSVLSPVLAESERNDLRYKLQKLREQAGYRARDRRYADAVQEALGSGANLPASGMARVPSAYYTYNTALQYQAIKEAAATTARSEAETLAGELTGALPPAVTALAVAEYDRLSDSATKLEAGALESKEKLAAAAAVMKNWAALQHRAADEADAKVTEAQNILNNFDWSASFPGDTKDCLPRPTDS
ncbi:hypothetical protein IV500_05250 [Paeniglutamicibacter antarcticus]|uniref:Uncharacterized protein n=1 Tax=Arthrobacter terrae TaxID=2935737 RepID=A0A931CPW3_9MICC|nr:hypothetical protein [Arthrobacter terrae]MBG0738826.1 hypothetical protein [Arthrobacter terrae]